MRISDWSSDVCSSDLPARYAASVIPLTILLVLQILLGAFTAGLNAGFAFNSWPLMGDRWFPENVPMLARYWQNLVDNPVVVQFAHRTLAYAVALAALATAWIAARRGAVRNAAELAGRSEEQTSELPSIMRNQYA